MAKPDDRQVRRAVAAAVRRDGGLVLAVLRPDEPGEELPGVWGLPAVTLRAGESREDGVRRLGREKLGVELTPLRSLAEGEQRREGYMLRMTVYEASMVGAPSLPPRRAEAAGTRYDAFDWLPPASFREAAEAGSLCCRLYLALTPTSGHPSPARGRGDGGEGHASEGRDRLRIPPELRRRMIDSARVFRKEPTRSEALLWRSLRDRKLAGRKFRRQHAIGPFVVDFYCARERLVVEIDGPIHRARQAADRERQELLEAIGLQVLRIRSEHVEGDIDGTLERIRGSFLALTPTSGHPSPARGRGAGGEG